MSSPRREAPPGPDPAATAAATVSATVSDLDHTNNSSSRLAVSPATTGPASHNDDTIEIVVAAAAAAAPTSTYPGPISSTAPNNNTTPSSTIRQLNKRRLHITSPSTPPHGPIDVYPISTDMETDDEHQHNCHRGSGCESDSGVRITTPNPDIVADSSNVTLHESALSQSSVPQTLRLASDRLFGITQEELQRTNSQDGSTGPSRQSFGISSVELEALDTTGMMPSDPPAALAHTVPSPVSQSSRSYVRPITPLDKTKRDPTWSPAIGGVASPNVPTSRSLQRWSSTHNFVYRPNTWISDADKQHGFVQLSHHDDGESGSHGPSSCGPGMLKRVILYLRPALFGLLFVIAAIVFMVFIVQEGNEAADSILFSELDAASVQIQTLLRSSTTNEVQVLNVLATTMAVTDGAKNMSRATFKTHADSVLAQFTAFSGVSFNPLVHTQTERRRLEAATRVDAAALGLNLGNVSFRNTSMTLDYTYDTYVPVLYIEPVQSNKGAILFDVWTNPDRRTAMIRARDAHLVSATSPLKLVQSNSSSVGFLAFAPVYRVGALLNSIQERRDAIIGFFVGVYQASVAIREAIKSYGGGMNVRVLDNSTVIVYLVLQPASSTLQEVDRTLVPPSGPDRQFSYGFAGRTFTVELYRNQNFISSSSTGDLTTLFVITIIVIIISTVYVFVISAYQYRIITNLQVLEAKAVSASHVKSAFIGFLCHEIRNPLHGLLAVVDEQESHQEAPDLEETRSAWRTARQCADSVVTILNDVLDVSKLGYGSMTLECIPVNLRQVVTLVKDIHGERAAKNNTVINVDVHPDVPHFVYTDPTRVAQVLHNLVSNSAKFTKGGEAIISITPCDVDEDEAVSTECGNANPSDDTKTTTFSDDSACTSHANADDADAAVADDDAVAAAAAAAAVDDGDADDDVPHIDQGVFRTFEVMVSDNGTGIREEYFEHILEAFSQEKVDVTRFHGGTGLGLHIVSKLVQLLGGRNFAIKSRLQFGTTFRFELELKVPDADTMKKLVKGHWDSAPELMGATVRDLHSHSQAVVPEEQKNTLSHESAQSRIPSASYEDSPDSATKQAFELQDRTLAGIRGRPNGREFLGTDSENSPSPWIATRSIDDSKRTNNADKSTMYVVDPGPNPDATLTPAQLMTEAKLLIVDDIALNRNILKRMLRKKVRAIDTANDGQEAIDAITRAAESGEPYDVVLMDLMMPVLGGLEATAKLRELGFTLPIVAVTANWMVEDVSKCRAAGMNDVLGKPFKRSDAIALVQRMLKRRAADHNA
jgi:signal transduction histidine kinase/ActR/RegA family two-component response regulator